MGCLRGGLSVLLPVIVGDGPHDELRALLDLFKNPSKILGDDAETEQLDRAE